MGFNLGMAGAAYLGGREELRRINKDTAMQEEELDARSRREEFASNRGLRDNAAAFEGEKVDQGRVDQRKAAADKQATQTAINRAAADFESQNPYQSQMEEPQGSVAPIANAPALQASAGILPSAATSSAAPAPSQALASLGANGIGGSAPTPAQGIASVAKLDSQSRSMERAAFIAQAVADQHLSNGNMAGYKEASDAAIHMRDALRAQRFSQADAEFAQNNDASIYVKKIFPLVNDGFSLVSASQQTGPDGKSVVTITRHNNQTGAEETKSVPVDNLLARMREIRTPGIIAATEEKIASEKRAVGNKIAEGAPKLASEEKIALMNDATRRITANAGATASRASAGYHDAAAKQIREGAPVWDKDADADLIRYFTKKDDVTGVTSVDGDGLQFSKKLALAQAKRNGGDTASARGYVYEVDNQLKARVDAAMKADPKADQKALLRTERANLLRILTTPKSDVPPADGGGAAFKEAQADSDAGKAHRIAEQRKMLLKEIAAQKNPQNIAVLQRELARMAPEPTQRNAAGSGLPVKAVAVKTKQVPASTAAADTGAIKATYEGWLATKSKISDLKSAAANMSRDNAREYLSRRLPELEALLKYHANYPTY